jgi:hypothetical protein
VPDLRTFFEKSEDELLAATLFLPAYLPKSKLANGRGMKIEAKFGMERGPKRGFDRSVTVLSN